MPNQTVAVVRGQSFTMFNASAASAATSQIFALPSRPIEPPYIAIHVVYSGGTGNVTPSLGILNPIDGTILWNSISAKKLTASGVILISGEPADFLKLTTDTVSGATITAVGEVA